VPSIAEICENLPPELDPVFRRAMAKDPRERFPDAAEFVATLRQALSEAAGSTRPFRPIASRAPTRTPRPAARWLALAALLAAGGIVGAILALTLGGGGDHSGRSAQTGKPLSVRTVTANGTTVRETITAPAPPPPPAASPPAPLPPAPAIAGSGHSLNDRGYALMRAGNYNAALPLLQNAVRKLRGTGPKDAYEGYANYNLGYTLLQLHRCRDALVYLRRAEQLEPQRSEPAAAIARAETCS
jgi:hypothetical protein